VSASAALRSRRQHPRRGRKTQKFPREISFKYVDIEGLVGHELLQPPVLAFELTQALGVAARSGILGGAKRAFYFTEAMVDERRGPFG
jgi:hypothetical protein